MLLILIATAWLALVVFFVVICQMAARGDAAMEAADLRAIPRASGVRGNRVGLTLFEDAPRLTAPRGAGPGQDLGHGAVMLRGRTGRRGARARRPRCITSS
jgi:hypothetical protein